jgi:hypothetical protein
MAPLDRVSVHPLVLLSVVDHFNRVAKDSRNTKKRVVGVLLGSRGKGEVDVTNSFAGTEVETLASTFDKFAHSTCVVMTPIGSLLCFCFRI